MLFLFGKFTFQLFIYLEYVSGSQKVAHTAPFNFLFQNLVQLYIFMHTNKINHFNIMYVYVY